MFPEQRESCVSRRHISYLQHPCWNNAVGGNPEAHRKKLIPLLSSLSFFFLAFPYSAFQRAQFAEPVHLFNAGQTEDKSKSLTPAV